MSYSLWEELHAGAASRTVIAGAERRSFAALVFQAERDFGSYLASAEDEHDLADRVVQVEAAMREAGVEDPLGVLEALAAKAEDDDTEDDSDDDSDVPSFVDTDEDDDHERDEDDADPKDKKEAAKTAAPGDLGLAQDPNQPIGEHFQDGKYVGPNPGGQPATPAAPIGASPSPAGQAWLNNSQQPLPAKPRQQAGQDRAYPSSLIPAVANTKTAEPLPPVNPTPGGNFGGPGNVQQQENLATTVPDQTQPLAPAPGAGPGIVNAPNVEKGAPGIGGDIGGGIGGGLGFGGAPRVPNATLATKRGLPFKARKS